MYFSSILLSAVEQALPPYGAGIPAKDVYGRVDGYGDTTIRHALRELIDRGRVTYTGSDKHRLYSLPQLPALARASEGEGLRLPSQVSPRNSAGVSSQVASAVFSEEVPTAELIRELAADGMNDEEIGEHFGRTKNYGCYIRNKFGIAPVLPLGRPSGDAPQAFGMVARREEEHAARYIAFFAEHGEYKSFGDHQIEKYERTYALRRARRRPADVTPVLYGDPAPNRVRV